MRRIEMKRKLGVSNESKGLPHFFKAKLKLKYSMEAIRSLGTVWKIFKDFLGTNMYSPVVSSSL